MFILDILTRDVIDIILNKVNIECHTCKLKFNFNKNFYKKEYNNYYCSLKCYNFI